MRMGSLSLELLVRLSRNWDSKAHGRNAVPMIMGKVSGSLVSVCVTMRKRCSL